jgi:hypothetical protein
MMDDGPPLTTRSRQLNDLKVSKSCFMEFDFRFGAPRDAMAASEINNDEQPCFEPLRSLASSHGCLGSYLCEHRVEC